MEGFAVPIRHVNHDTDAMNESAYRNLMGEPCCCKPHAIIGIPIGLNTLYWTIIYCTKSTVTCSPIVCCPPIMFSSPTHYNLNNYLLTLSLLLTLC